MPRLSTGFVRANGYANKVRKVLFALTRGKVVPENVVRASAHLNQYLFDKLQELSVKKEDVVRISIGFSSELLLPHGRSFSDRAFTASGNSSTEPLYGDLCPRGVPDKEVYLRRYIYNLRAFIPSLSERDFSPALVKITE